MTRPTTGSAHAVGSLGSRELDQRWLRRHSPSIEGDLRLVCIPCAGRGASMCCAWPRGLPRYIEVWALQPPGREERLREEPLADIGALVREAATAAEPLLHDRPFAIFGHSMGALIAFELTRELRRRGGPQPRRLFVSGHTAPQAGAAGPLRCDLPDAAFVQAIQALNPEMRRDTGYLDALYLMLPTLRADFTLSEHYRYVGEDPLMCDLFVWAGMEDPETPESHLVGWREHTTGRLSQRMFPGDPFFIRTQTDAVLHALVEELA